MPNPVTPSPTSTSWLDGAPGADKDFDEVFGTTPEATTSSSPNPEPQTTTTSAASEPTPAPQAWEPLRTSTGTIYNTREDALKGTEEKDSLIAQLREQLKNVTGQDPVQAARHPQPAPISYLGNPQKYAEDLGEAAKKGDAAKYQQIQLQLYDEYLGPAKPILQEFARTNAQSKVRSEIKDFDTFMNSEDYGKTLASSPVLAQAIKGAEADFRYASQLNELYGLVYDRYMSRTKLPEIVRNSQQTGAPAPTAAPTARPVVTSGTLSPGAPVTSQSDQELMTSSQGRQELIARFKAQGIDNTRW